MVWLIRAIVGTNVWAYKVLGLLYPAIFALHLSTSPIMFRNHGKLSALGLMLAFSFCIVEYRVLQTDVRIFRFFWWNLILALIPFLCSEALRGAAWRGVMLAGLSILFLPNAPYMITDLFHLRTRVEFPLWYDTMLIFWFAAVGLVLFYLTLFNLETFIRRYLSSVSTHITISVICLLNGFGIYLGRFLRFNSWDILSNYDDLAEQVLDRIINPGVHTRTVGVTLLYGFSLLVGYWMIRLFTSQRPQRQN
jgi:uncharacterized membrane protein